MTREGYKIAGNLIANIDKRREALKRIEELWKCSCEIRTDDSTVRAVPIPPGAKPTVLFAIEQKYREEIRQMENELENL